MAVCASQNIECVHHDSYVEWTLSTLINSSKSRKNMVKLVKKFCRVSKSVGLILFIFFKYFQVDYINWFEGFRPHWSSHSSRQVRTSGFKWYTCKDVCFLPWPNVQIMFFCNDFSSLPFTSSSGTFSLMTAWILQCDNLLTSLRDCKFLWTLFKIGAKQINSIWMCHNVKYVH